MLKNQIIFLFSFSLLFSHPVVKNLDIDKFMGRWYVFSLIPNWIESGATNSYDEYTLNKDGTIGITYKAIKNGKERTVKQKGTIVDKKNPAIWEIQFTKPWGPFFKAPYEVILLEDNYEYMVVGYPDNSFGWIMTRSTTMELSLYNNILNTLEKDFGYNKNDFQRVLHNN